MKEDSRFRIFLWGQYLFDLSVQRILFMVNRTGKPINMIAKFPVLSKIIKNYLQKRYERFPELISIEITTACNAKCIMCPRETLTRPVKHMPFKIFEKIINDCKGMPLKKINLFWFGDPVCNPRIIQYLEKIRNDLPGVKLYISTNAELLTPELSNQILEKKLLDVINFDIDGFTRETYENVRVGVNFHKVVENTNYFINKKKKMRLRRPQVRVTIIKMKETEKEIDQFKQYWGSRADKVDINNYNTWLGSMEDKNVGSTLEKSQNGSFTYPCIHPWNQLVLSTEGVAGLCCLDYDLTAETGNLENNSIAEIWSGSIQKKYRENLIRLEYDQIECCSKCNAFIYQDKSFWAKLWQQKNIKK